MSTITRHPFVTPVILCISLPSIIARIMISNRSLITCLLFCHYWEYMKRLQRISAISAKYSGSRDIRSSEVLLKWFLYFLGSGPVGDNDLWYHHTPGTLCSHFLSLILLSHPQFVPLEIDIHHRIGYKTSDMVIHGMEKRLTGV